MNLENRCSYKPDTDVEIEFSSMKCIRCIEPRECFTRRYEMKPTLICIIGESGSGKTLCAEYISKNYNINYIQSYTDRPKRIPDELGHTFITDKEFDEIKKEDMIAYTKFGEYRYCATKQQIRFSIPNVYVIDEDGLKILEEKYSNEYTVKSLRIWRPNNPLTGIDEERRQRNIDKFVLPLNCFDYKIHNNSTIEEFEKNIARIIKDI